MRRSSLLTSPKLPVAPWSTDARPPLCSPEPNSAPFAGPRVEFLVNQTLPELEHLIMVPGHGVTITESLDGADSKDVDWFLLDYQKDKDVPRALVAHMRGGLDELDSDRAALLLFSGEMDRHCKGGEGGGGGGCGHSETKRGKPPRERCRRERWRRLAKFIPRRSRGGGVWHVAFSKRPA